jgi:hypothetical protein
VLARRRIKACDNAIASGLIWPKNSGELVQSFIEPAHERVGAGIRRKSPSFPAIRNVKAPD